MSQASERGGGRHTLPEAVPVGVWGAAVGGGGGRAQAVREGGGPRQDAGGHRREGQGRQGQRGQSQKLRFPFVFLFFF